MEKHRGKDYIKGENVKSLVYMKVTYVLQHQINLQIIGTKKSTKIIHLDAKDTKNIKKGDIFKPGDIIAPFPETKNLNSTGPHLEVQLWDDGKLLDPDTLVPAPSGTRFYYGEYKPTLKSIKKSHTIFYEPIWEKNFYQP